jgi:hypothetical protein
MHTNCAIVAQFNIFVVVGGGDFKKIINYFRSEVT